MKSFIAEMFLHIRVRPKTKGEIFIMTIAQWFDENEIKTLPVLSICICRGMKKWDSIVEEYGCFPKGGD